MSGPFFCASRAPGDALSSRLFAAGNPGNPPPTTTLSSLTPGLHESVPACLPSSAEPVAASVSLNRDALDTGEG